MSHLNIAKGFRFGGCASHIKPQSDKLDLALIVSETMCQVGAVYTRNKVKADPLLLNKKVLQDGQAQAVVINSQNANACAKNGMENAIREQKAAARFLDLEDSAVLVASTGVIGQELPVAQIEQSIDSIVLGHTLSSLLQAEKAIMTTDTVEKTASAQVVIDSQVVTITGLCKGSGMIHPNMGTMLAFIMSDANIDQALLQKALYENTQKTFNRVSVDGDTSTNDMCLVLANGLANHKKIEQEGSEYTLFKEALCEVMTSLAVQIAKDGEGASRLVTCVVDGAMSEAQAEILAKSIISSSLCKAAMFGHDANWGRVLCAMGYSGADFSVTDVDVVFESHAGSIKVCEQGKGLDFDEEKATEVLLQPEVTIHVSLHEGDALCTCWGCDLTYDYVKINGDYRT